MLTAAGDKLSVMDDNPDVTDDKLNDDRQILFHCAMGAFSLQIKPLPCFIPSGLNTVSQNHDQSRHWLTGRTDKAKYYIPEVSLTPLDEINLLAGHIAHRSTARSAQPWACRLSPIDIHRSPEAQSTFQRQRAQSRRTPAHYES